MQIPDEPKTAMNFTETFPPLRVVLPDELKRFYSERGYLPPTPHEERRFARLNVRSHGRIRFYPAPPNLIVGTGNDRTGTVLVKDLSRSGIAVLYHRQIFPGEQFDVLMHGRWIHSTAVRCRRIGSQCYETGATIRSVISSDGDGDEHSFQDRPESH